MSHLLRTIKERWCKALRAAEDVKKKSFGNDAAEAMRFFASTNYSFMYSPAAPETSGLTGAPMKTAYRATANLVANMVRVLLPAIFFEVPYRNVVKREQPIPVDVLKSWASMSPEAPPELQMLVQMDMMYQQQAMLAQQMGMQPPPPPPDPNQSKELAASIRAAFLEAYINYSANAMGLEKKSEAGIVEALIKGRGVLWPTLLKLGDGTFVAGSEWVSIDDILIDPEAKFLLDAKWIARKVVLTVDEASARYERNAEDFRTKGESYSQAAAVDAAINADQARQNGATADVVTVTEVYSLCGIGQGLGSGTSTMDNRQEDVLRQFSSVFPKACFVAICEDMDSPVNMPPELMDVEVTDQLLTELVARCSWPVPYHENPGDPWPFGELDFHLIPGLAWPQAHIAPALPYVKFINWLYSFMMTRVKLTSRTFMAVDKSLEKENKEALLSGDDLTLISANAAKLGLENIVAFLQQQPVNMDLWTILAQIKREFEDATAVTELNMSGRLDQQMRSATEAQVRQQATDNRIGKMAQCVVNWQNRVAMKEGMLAQYLLESADVARVFGEPAPQPGQMMMTPMGPQQTPPQRGIYTAVWDTLVHSEDATEIMSQHTYSIQTGSSRRKDQESEAQLASELLQTLGPQASQLYAATGVAAPYNALVANYVESRQLPDPQRFMVPDRIQEVIQQQAMALMQQQGAQEQPEGAAA